MRLSLNTAPSRVRTGFQYPRIAVAVLATIISVPALMLRRADADDQTWLPNANNNWSTSDLNWAGPAAWTQGNNAIFGGTGVTVTLTEPITVGNITFNSGGYTIAGNATNTLGLGSSTIDTGANNATISASLAGSGSTLTKIGAGTLTLSGANSYTGATTVSVGTLRFAKVASFYSTTGGVTAGNAALLSVSSGATAAFNVGGTGEFSTTDITTLLGAISSNNGFQAGSSLALDASNATGGITISSVITDANGGANSLGFAKFGKGSITLTGANTYTGTTIVAQDGVSVATGANSLVLNCPTGNAISGNLQIGNNGTGFATVELNASNQIADTSVVSFVGTSGNYSFLNLKGNNETVGGLSSAANGVVEAMETQAVSTNSTLTLNTASGTSYSYTGYMRNKSNGTGTGTFSLVKDGSGTQTLVGGTITYTGTTTVKNGRLVLQNTTSFASATTTVNSGGVLELNSTNTAVDSWRLNTVLAGSGTININNGTTGWVETYTNANTFSGTVNIMGGTFGASFLNSNWTGITADFNISSGALLDARGQAITVGSINGNGNVGSTFTGTTTVNIGAGDKSGSFAGSIQGNGSSGTNSTANPNASALNLVKIGAGTQILSGTNTYSGATTVNGGTLLVSGSITGSTALINGGSLQVASGGTVASTTVTLSSGSIVNNGTIANATTVNGGTLSGTGLMSSLLTVNTGGTLAPGQSNAGFLLLNNGFTLNSGGHLAMTLSGTGFTTQYSAVNVTGGSVTLGGDLQLSLGYTPAVGDIFYVLVNQAGSAINGMFSNAVDQGNGTGLITAGGDQFLVSYSASYASSSFTGGQDIALQVMSVVPEPSTWSALIGGAGVLLGLRRRRRVS